MYIKLLGDIKQNYRCQTWPSSYGDKLEMYLLLLVQVEILQSMNNFASRLYVQSVLYIFEYSFEVLLSLSLPGTLCIP